MASSTWHGGASSWHLRIYRRGISPAGPLYAAAPPGMRLGRLRASTGRSMLASFCCWTAAPSLATVGTVFPLEQPTKDVTEATTIAMIRMGGESNKTLHSPPPISARSLVRRTAWRSAARPPSSRRLHSTRCPGGGIASCNGMLDGAESTPSPPRCRLGSTIWAGRKFQVQTIVLE